jgi:hypothetical protein
MYVCVCVVCVCMYVCMYVGISDKIILWRRIAKVPPQSSALNIMSQYHTPLTLTNYKGNINVIHRNHSLSSLFSQIFLRQNYPYVFLYPPEMSSLAKNIFRGFNFLIILNLGCEKYVIENC